MSAVIRNGGPWQDTEGKRMHAQFPHILYHEGKYYLYGSNKEFSNGTTGIWHWGIRMYESSDLCSWKDLGLIIAPDEKDKDSLLYPGRTVDAPCIIYNVKTQKWVCWMIDMSQMKAFTLVSDSLFGPYVVSSDLFFPCDLPIGDFDLMQTEDGKGYIYFNCPHTKIVCAELTEDFTGVTGRYTTTLHHPESVPFSREAPAHFCRDGKHYLITSGTTAFFPNPSEVAVSQSPMGDFQVLGDPHAGDPSKTSFHSQVRSVFKHPHKKDLYIALADRWLPQYMNLPYEVYKEWFRIWFHDRKEELLDRVKREGEEYQVKQFSEEQDVSLAEYVVLPIVFDGDRVTIAWRDAWSPNEFDNE